MINKLATIVPMLAVFLFGVGFHYRWTCVPRDYGWCVLCVLMAVLNGACILWTVSSLQNSARFLKRRRDYWSESSKWWAQAYMEDSK